LHVMLQREGPQREPPRRRANATLAFCRLLSATESGVVLSNGASLGALALAKRIPRDVMRKGFSSSRLPRSSLVTFRPTY